MKTLLAYLARGVTILINLLAESFQQPISKQVVVGNTLASLLSILVLLVSATIMLAINICAPYMGMQTLFAWTVSAVALKLLGIVGGVAIGIFLIEDFHKWARLALCGSAQDYLKVRTGLRMTAFLSLGAGMVMTMVLSFHPGLVPLEVGAILDTLGWIASMLALVGVEALVFFGLIVVLKSKPEQEAA